MTFKPDLVQKAWLLAATYHEGQRYYTAVEGESLPYLTHLGAVLNEAQNALHYDKSLSPKLMLLCAILHDTLEDTKLTAETLKTAVGNKVLAGVQALTKDETLPTKCEQMEDSINRILEQPREIAAVKLCDRICNISSAPPSYWTKEKKDAYREEARYILERLGPACGYLRKRLAEKIEEY